MYDGIHTSAQGVLHVEPPLFCRRSLPSRLHQCSPRADATAEHFRRRAAERGAARGVSVGLSRIVQKPLWAAKHAWRSPLHLGQRSDACPPRSVPAIHGRRRRPGANSARGEARASSRRAAFCRPRPDRRQSSALAGSVAGLPAALPAAGINPPVGAAPDLPPWRNRSRRRPATAKRDRTWPSAVTSNSRPTTASS